MFHPPIIVYWFGVFHLFPSYFQTRVICYVLHSQTLVVVQIILPLSCGWLYSPVRYFTLEAYGTPEPLITLIPESKKVTKNLTFLT